MRIHKPILFLLLSTALTVSAEPRQMTLKGLDGEQHALSDYIGHGKWVVINVWSTACKFCRHELPDLVDFHEQHADKDAMVVGIVIDLDTFGYPDEQTVINFVQDYFVDYPNLFASSDQAAEFLGASITSIPISFFYTPDGFLVGYWQGIVTKEDIEKIISGKRSKDRELFGSGEKSRRKPHEK